MRLLQWTRRGLKFTKNFLPTEKIPKYAILSHRWDRDEDEVTYKDVCDGRYRDKPGYEKLAFCANRARNDHLQYFWVDTCCIDKSNQAELQEAIISMFAWYKASTRCYVYMPDLSSSVNIEGDAFREHSWFTRGWTLQELIAPVSVEFFAKDGVRLGDKNALATQIQDITGIPISLLRGTSELSSFDTEERFRWAEKRQTTRGEDAAYCLMGIFGISITALYGEKKDEANRRLRAEVAASKQRQEVWRKRVENRVWQVPFERNPCFTGRTDELKTVRRQLFTKHRTAKIVITGLGGVGKTNFVIELLYHLREEYPDCSFLWISATTDESLSQAYHKAAQALRIPGWDDKEADIKQLVQDHISSEEAGRTVLVFDNADDISMWVSRAAPGARRLLDSLPKGDHVSILVTTRNNELAHKLISSPQCLVELPDVGEHDSKELLRKLLVNKDLLNNDEEVVELLQWLTHLPLAIVQAANYINQRACSLQTYLELLDDQEENVVELLSHDFEDHARLESDGKNPIATTWLVSFKQIRDNDTLAAYYLSFMACVDSKDIPLSLLPPDPSRKKVVDALGTLQGYSFITRQSAQQFGDAAITIHRLVHLATRNWLRMEGQLPRWAGTVTEVMETRKTKLGVDHPSTLTSMANLASTFWNQGRWEEAEKLEVQVMETSKTKLGVDHPSTLTSIANLASTFWNQGRWEEAEKLDVQVMETRKTKLGVDHPSTLTSIANLASTFWNQGRWEEAEKLDVQVMETRKTKLGVDHPDTLTSMANLASTFWNQGRWEEAEKLFVQVMETSKTKLGVDHPDTLTSMANLASTYRNQGRWEEAEKLEVQVMETRKTKLGVDHPSTLTSMANLALTWKCQGRHIKALALMKDCALARQRTLGPKHPDFVSSIATIEEWS
ncbi:hypothetical protein Sste5346_007920 [Sporothrix stenoceras]|uniref:Uncharacterized protein n=1 Tax=Sporothrix stenoceras TaxID=5173 RepID=A0ABR3YUT3_9PEZI